MGSIEDFKYLVNYLHSHKISVILDWIPAHFCTDDYALTKFDGTNQFEPSGFGAFFSMRYAVVSNWGTKPFDYTKPEVRDFLYSSAAYWLKEMHIDGLRVDAVQIMLQSENKRSAKLFLRSLNDFIHKEHPGVLTMAEDYSGALKTTKATTAGGLGFDYKWNTNWAKHILDYLAVIPKMRPFYYNRLLQAIVGDLFHKMILAISHDEILHGPLIDLTPELTEAGKCANMRVLYSLMATLPGKKLLFMGSDIGSDSDWNSLVATSKGVYDRPVSVERKKILSAISALNTLYKNHSALYKHDDNAHDLEWIENNDPEGCFIAFRRSDETPQAIACFHNFSVDLPKRYKVTQVNLQSVKEVFNSDRQEYGGTGKSLNLSIEAEVDAAGFITNYYVIVPPLSTVVIQEERL